MANEVADLDLQISVFEIFVHLELFQTRITAGLKQSPTQLHDQRNAYNWPWTLPKRSGVILCGSPFGIVSVNAAGGVQCVRGFGEPVRGRTHPHRENVRRIIGQRTRREFSIGDRARIILDRADPLERKLQFSIVEPVRRKQKKKL